MTRDKFSFGRTKISGDNRNSFNFPNALSYSFVHPNYADFLISAKKCIDVSPTQERNHDKADSFPVTCWTFFTDVELLISMIIWNLFGFASIPRCVSMNSMNFPSCTPNVHLLGFSVMSNFLIDSKFSLKPFTCFSSLCVFTNISST